MYPASFYRDQPLFLRQLHAGLYGVIERIAEYRTDIKRLQHVLHMFQRNLGAKVNPFLPGCSRLIPNDDVQIFIAGMIIILVIPNPVLQFPDGQLQRVSLIRLCLQHQQMILQVVIYTAHPFFLTDAVPVICLPHLQLLRTICRLHGTAQINRQVDASETGQNRGNTDRIDEQRIVPRYEEHRHKHRHERRQHDDVHHQPHFRRQIRYNLPKRLPEDPPRRGPEGESAYLADKQYDIVHQPLLPGPLTAGPIHGRIRKREKDTRTQIDHHIIDCSERRIENQQCRQFLRPSSAMEYHNISAKSEQRPEKIPRVLRVNDGFRYKTARKKSKHMQEPALPAQR